MDRNPKELSRSISLYRDALELRCADHPDRPATLLHLIEVLLYHYGKLGFEESTGEIMRLVSEVQGSCPEDSHERRASDLALQTYTFYKAINSGSLVDIDNLIPGLHQAVQDTPYDYFDKLQRLSNLVLVLWMRYEICDDIGDLNESIAIHEDALQFPLYALGLPSRIQLLRERETATSGGDWWKDALVTANSVSPSFFSGMLVLSPLHCSSWSRNSQYIGPCVNVSKESTNSRMPPSVAIG